ncbi:MAG TPA: DNA translocase FtsK [bacterium]|nr:DNA translocase FtsK [bacterium]
MSQKKNDQVQKKESGEKTVRKAPKKDNSSISGNIILIEIITAVTVLLAVFILISLGNYSVSAARDGFFTGTIGFDTAHFMINIFGIVSYMVPVLIILALLVYINRYFLRYLILNILTFCMLLPFFYLISGYFQFYGLKNENFAGKILFDKLFTVYLGTTGFIMIFVCWMTVYLILSFNFSYFYIFRKLALLWTGFINKLREMRLVDRDSNENDEQEEETVKPEKEIEPENIFEKISVTIPQYEPEPVVEEKPEELHEITKEEDIEIEKRSEAIAVQVKEQDTTGLHKKVLRSFNDYKLPSLDLLAGEDKVKAIKDREKKIQAIALLIERKLLEHRLKVTVKGATIGPVVTMYEIELGEGVRVNQVAAMEQDLGVAVGGKRTRVVSSIPGKPYIGIEVPNDDRLMIRLRTVLRSDVFSKHSTKGLPVALGQDVEGISFAANLIKMPHLLVAGTTGSGKSVGINTIIMSLLYTLRPDEVKFVMIDPKGNEFNIYEGIPHLLLPVVVDSKKAAKAMMWAVNEMEERFHRLAENMVRDIEAYNEKVESINKNLANPEQFWKKMPFIVIVIDEFADLMMVAGKDVEIAVSRIAQKARAVGIHLIIATQRPTRDVVTGLIKSNLPVRIAFRVASALDSRTILDSNGAEMLLGNGDMLYIPPGSSEAVRVHGAFVSTEEIKKVVEFIKSQFDEESVAEDAAVSTPPDIFLNDDSAEGSLDGDEKDPLYDEILAYVLQTEKCSASMLQRKFKIGYNRAARAVETLEADGIISPADGSKPRTVIPQK